MTFETDIDVANRRIQELEAEVQPLRGGMEYLEKSKIPWLEGRIKELLEKTP